MAYSVCEYDESPDLTTLHEQENAKINPFPARPLKAVLSDHETQTDCHWKVTEYDCEAT